MDQFKLTQIQTFQYNLQTTFVSYWLHWNVPNIHDPHHFSNLQNIKETFPKQD